jgi:hypothetical protein
MEWVVRMTTRPFLARSMMSHTSRRDTGSMPVVYILKTKKWSQTLASVNRTEACEE